MALERADDGHLQ